MPGPSYPIIILTRLTESVRVLSTNIIVSQVMLVEHSSLLLHLLPVCVLAGNYKYKIHRVDIVGQSRMSVC